MKIDKVFFENNLKKHESPNGRSYWFVNQTHGKSPEETIEYSFTIPDEVGNPKSESLEQLLIILNNLDEIHLKSISFIKGHLSINGDFSLQGIEILNKPDKPEAEAILHYWCDEDGYLYTEIGLLALRPHYLLIKYW